MKLTFLTSLFVTGIAFAAAAKAPVRLPSKQTSHKTE